jgi:hypothetical protein
MMTAFYTGMKEKDKDTITPEEWKIYRDIETLLFPLGYKNTV